MMSSFAAIKVLVVVLLALAMPVVVVWTVAKLLQGLFWALAGVGKGLGATFRGAGAAVRFAVRHVWRFASGIVLDSLRFAGAVITAGVIAPLALLNFCFGRWSTAVHYGRALEDELGSAAVSLYRVGLGHPIRFLGLGILTEGIERRLPDLVARAPQAPARRAVPGRFEGYKVSGTLPPGGSGALLYLARPLPGKLVELRAAGHPDPGQVVIKSFALGAGSTLPQIVRESRALEAASRLGLVLEHRLTEDAFHYVMPYVPGERLDEVITSMHERSVETGLSQRGLQTVMGYAADMLQTLDRFHAGGLWHKDIKPGNLIVSNHRVHLVDLGLVTPLQSAMTLTTHGTEYFRDPEMVRLAMKGVKVHEVDGVKFDIYSAGAVLYAMVENSFPAHGSLSRITKRCPEALKWIVRRSMADMGARYAHAWEMLADLRMLLAARDPFAVAPADLPSVKGEIDWAALGANGDREPFFEPAPLRPVGVGGLAPAGVAGDLPTQGTRRRRTQRALLAAGVWSMLLGGSVAGLVALKQARDGEARFTIFHHESARAAQESGTVRDGERLAALESARWNADDQLGWADHIAPLLVPRAEPPRVRGQAATAAAVAGDGRGSVRVLVVEDLSAVTDRAGLDALYRSLADEGVAVLGGRGQAGDPGAVELEAGARKALGLGDPDDADAARRLREFLLGTAELDAIVWVTDGGEDGGPRYHLVARSTELPADSGLAAAQRN